MTTHGHPLRRTRLLWVSLLLLTGCSPQLKVYVESFRNQPPPGFGTRFAFVQEGDRETIELLQRSSGAAVEAWLTQNSFSPEEPEPDFVHHPLAAAAHASAVEEVGRQLERAGWVADADNPNVLVAVEGRSGRFHFWRPRQVTREQVPRTAWVQDRDHKNGKDERGNHEYHSVTVYDERTTVIPAGPASCGGTAAAITIYAIDTGAGVAGDETAETGGVGGEGTTLHPAWQGVIVTLYEGGLDWQRWHGSIISEVMGEYFNPSGQRWERWLKLPKEGA